MGANDADRARMRRVHGALAVNRRELLIGLAGAAVAGPVAAHCASRAPFNADGLSFLPEDPADIARSGMNLFICDVSDGEMREDAQGNPVYYRSFERCDGSIERISARIRAEFPQVDIALKGTDVARDGRVAAVFQFQGCEPLEDDISRIAYFSDKGLRVLQLTHNESNAFASAYVDERSGEGLSSLGTQAVAEMNRLNVIPDVSHASEATALEAVRRSKRPVILSHGACRALLPHPRAATDAMIRAVAESGGVFGVFMMSFWLTQAPVPLPSHYVAHIRHAVDLAGIDAVGVANDYAFAGLSHEGRPFDNATDMPASYHDWWRANQRRGIPGFASLPGHAVIAQFNAIDRIARIRQALEQGGFRASEIDKIAGLNWKHFFEENLR